MRKLSFKNSKGEALASCARIHSRNDSNWLYGSNFRKDPSVKIVSSGKEGNNEKVHGTGHVQIKQVYTLQKVPLARIYLKKVNGYL